MFASSDYHRKRNILDFIFFLRPMLHPPVWTVVILGYSRSPVRNDSPYMLIWLLLLSSAAAGWAYIANQITDIESDRVNQKLFFLPNDLISMRSAYILATILGLATIIGAFFLSMTLGILFTIGIGMGYIYSGKPFFGKDRPFISALLNGAAHGLMPFLAGYVGAGGGFVQGLIRALPYLFAVVAVFVGTTIPDIDGDMRIGKRTPGVALGLQYSTVVMTLSLMTALLLSLILWDIPLIIAANLSLPFYLAATIRPTIRKSLVAIKISILLLSITACVRFWPYSILLLILFGGTHLYYRLRFDMAYPRLT